MAVPAASLATGTFTQICKMRRDNYSRGDFTIMTDGTTVWLSEQAYGQDRKQHFKCSRRIFNSLIAQYQKERKVRR